MTKNELMLKLQQCISTSEKQALIDMDTRLVIGKYNRQSIIVHVKITRMVLYVVSVYAGIIKITYLSDVVGEMYERKNGSGLEKCQNHFFISHNHIDSVGK